MGRNVPKFSRNLRTAAWKRDFRTLWRISVDFGIHQYHGGYRDSRYRCAEVSDVEKADSGIKKKAAELRSADAGIKSRRNESDLKSCAVLGIMKI